MSEWEPFDDELAGALRRRAGSVGDPLATDAAHRAVLSRATGIRRRRAAVAGGGTLTVLLVAGLAVLTTGGEGDDALAPADTTFPGSSVPQVTVTATSTTEESYQHDSSMTATTMPGTGSTIVLTVPPISDGSTTTASTPSTETQTTATTDPGAPSTSAGTTPTTSPAPPSTAQPVGNYEYRSAGGTIVVAFNGSSISLVGQPTPNSGYTAEVENDEGDRVRVRFRSDAGDSRIECRLVNGQLVRVE